MYSKIKAISTLSLIFLLLTLPVFVQELYASGDSNTLTTKVCGYVNPDFTFNENVSSQVKSGFKVEIDELKISSVTDANGYFEIIGVPRSSTGYSLNITRSGYLKRNLKNIITPIDLCVQGKLQISTSKSPVLMYAGDMARNGIQDNVVNLNDIMVLARSFNTTADNSRYNSDADINKDSAINMLDIILVADHFNTTSENYPDNVKPLTGILYIDTPDSHSVNIAFSRGLNSFYKSDFSIEGLMIYEAYPLSLLTQNSENAYKNVIHLNTTQQTPGKICKLLFDEVEYEFTCFQGQDAALSTIKLDGLAAQYIKNDHSQVKLTWNPLTQMQKNAICATGYKVLCCSTDDVNYANTITIPITDMKYNSIMISGLNINKEYKFAVCISSETSQSPLSQYITVSESAPLPISMPIEVSALNNNEVAVVFDNEVSNYSSDDFNIHTGLKINSIKPMDGNKNVLVLSTSNQVSGYPYTIIYKNKASFVFTGTDFKSSGVKAEALSSRLVLVTLGTAIPSESFKGNEFTVKDQKGNLLNVISVKPDESDVLNRTLLLTLASDMNKEVIYTLIHKTNTANFKLDTDVEKPVVTSTQAINEREIEIKFSKPVNYIGANFEIAEKFGDRRPLQVTGVKYRERNVVILTVDGMRNATLYSASISNVTDSAGNVIDPYSTTFGGISNSEYTTAFDHPDALKIISVQAFGPDKIIAGFNSSLDPDSIVLSNFKVTTVYGTQSPLTLSSVRLAKKGDIYIDGTEFTSDETAGKFIILSVDSYTPDTLYKLDVQNIYSTEGASISLTGNISTFVGSINLPNQKISRITGIEYAGAPYTEIIVSFDQNAGPSAIDVSHYTISDGVGHPSKAEVYPDEPRKVKLTIPVLTPGKTYTLTVKNLENSTGIPMDPQGVESIFTALGSQELPQMVAVISTDRQTLRIYFDRDVRDSKVDGPIWNSRTNTLSDKAVSYMWDDSTTFDLEDFDEYVYQDPNYQYALIVRINAPITYNGIPKLIGDPLKFSADSTELRFAVNNNKPDEILVENVVSLNSMSVRVYFNMPVYGTLDTFADINTISHFGTSGAITLSNPTAIDNTYKVYDFKLSSALGAGRYYLNINPALAAPNDIIKDKPTAGIGYVGMKDEDTSTPGFQQERLFAGIPTP